MLYRHLRPLFWVTSSSLSGLVKPLNLYMLPVFPSLSLDTTDGHALDLIPGYFAVDTDSTPDKLVFNRTVTLRDSYGKAGPK